MNKNVLLNDTSSENHFGSDLVSFQLLEIFKAFDIRFEVVHHVGEPFDRVLAETTMGVVVVNAEGTVHGNSSYVRSLLDAISACRKRCKKLIILNATFEDLREEQIAILESADLIICRDRASLRLLDRASNTHYIPDLAFFSLHDLPFPPKGLPRHRLAVSCAKVKPFFIRNFLISVARRAPFFTLFRQQDEGNVLVGNVRLINSYVGKRDVILRPIRSMLTALAVARVRSFKDLNSLTKFIRQCDHLVTGRYHCVVMCIMLSVPFTFHPGDTRKIENLLEDLSLNDRRVDANNNLKDWGNEELMAIQNFKNQIDNFRASLLSEIGQVLV